MPVEYDATAAGTVPDDIPGMRIVKYAWENSPWTRVSFGTEWVLDPTGEHILSVGFHKHGNLPMVETLEKEWEKALTRFARIRSHERGSQAEAEELAKVEAEIEADMPINRPCWTDLNVGTIETLRVVATDDPSGSGSATTAGAGSATTAGPCGATTPAIAAARRRPTTRVRSSRA